MSHHLRDYAALMRARGFRVTPQRQMILEAIDESHTHTTLKECAHAREENLARLSAELDSR